MKNLVKLEIGVKFDMKTLVIMIPGLGNDSVYIYNPMLNWWRKKGIEMLLFKTEWRSKENYQKKIKRLLDLIDEKSKNNKVSLIGMSAGGSLAVNAFSERKDKINKVITVCSRLRIGKMNGLSGFKKRVEGYPSFKESIIKTEEKEKLLAKKERQQIMTVHALFGDQLIKANTAIIDGARNITVATMGHRISIASSLTIFSKPLREFTEEV